MFPCLSSSGEVQRKTKQLEQITNGMSSTERQIRCRLLALLLVFLRFCCIGSSSSCLPHRRARSLLGYEASYAVAERASGDSIVWDESESSSY